MVVKSDVRVAHVKVPVVDFIQSGRIELFDSIGIST